jgi:hypothetical protein
MMGNKRKENEEAQHAKPMVRTGTDHRLLLVVAQTINGEGSSIANVKKERNNSSGASDTFPVDERQRMNT